jgi:Heat induced stress protein YflT
MRASQPLKARNWRSSFKDAARAKWKGSRRTIMAGKNTAAFGIFSNRASAEAAVDTLKKAGFSTDDISVLMADKQGSHDFAAEKNTKAPEGAATGAGVGGGVGGVLGLMAGIGALAIPGIGPLIAAGPIMGALAGLGVGGAVGGFVGALVGMGIPEYEAKRYEGRVKEGGILLSVHCDNSEEVSRAKDVLKDAGAEDVSSAGEKSVSTHGVEKDHLDSGHVGGTMDTTHLETHHKTTDEYERDITGDVVLDPSRPKSVERDPVLDTPRTVKTV